MHTAGFIEGLDQVFTRRVVHFIVYCSKGDPGMNP